MEFRNSHCNHLISAMQVFTACPGNSPGQREPAQLELQGTQIQVGLLQPEQKG